MNYVSIEGDASAIAGMDAVPGIMSGTQKTERLEGGRWRVRFFCSDEAITSLQSLGFVVEVRQDSDEITNHLSALEDDSDGSAIV